MISQIQKKFLEEQFATRYNFNYIWLIKNNSKRYLFQIKNLLYNIKYT